MTKFIQPIGPIRPISPERLMELNPEDILTTIVKLTCIFLFYLIIVFTAESISSCEYVSDSTKGIVTPSVLPPPQALKLKSNIAHNKTAMFIALSFLTYFRLSTVFRAKRDTDFVRIRSILPFSQSLIISLNRSRFETTVPVIPSSA